MFGLKPKPEEPISHWYSLIHGFSMPVKEFYERIEAELKSREVPGLEMQRVDFAEGGLLSADRIYLRMQRETLVFDICAAPFGKSFFFSCRFAEIPMLVTLWHLLAMAFIFVITFYLFVRFFSLWGLIYFPLTCLATIYVLRNALSFGLRDLDATLIKSPIFGPIYMRFLRRETYYRQDTRLMYCDMVNEVAKQAVEAVTGAKGIEIIRLNEHNPLLEELYRPRFIKVMPEKSKS
ncbi:MAG: hypothetical protein ACXWIU_03430 [Limisphaerales bacterium]